MIPTQVFAESIVQFLGPVAGYLADPEVSEVMINGPQQVYVERAGRLELTTASFASEEAVMAALRNIGQACGKLVDLYNPILEATLPDGSRVQGVLRPLATSGPYVAIRRFFQSRLTPQNLVKSGSLSALAAQTLHAMVEGKLNLMIAGGTGTGKTSLLNLFTSWVPESERIGVLEDSKEVQVQRPHVFQMEARQADDAAGIERVTIRELFRASLRMRPDRLIIGEIRGAEALDIVQAMVSGHGGCMGTLHASAPDQALMRLETMAMMSDVQMPLSALRFQIGAGIDAIVQVSRERDGRRVVTHVSEVAGYDGKHDSYQVRPIFQRKYGPNGEASRLLPTGLRPRFAERMLEQGA
ncbi:MAG TPA: ATPase, T2SS/T4P/T4SS family, partial [Polyangiaceae bacterium]|nr:ATPase, T2SS/T4P/T4SS family [Polyangiaceae bacterium]